MKRLVNSASDEPGQAIIKNELVDQFFQNIDDGVLLLPFLVTSKVRVKLLLLHV